MVQPGNRHASRMFDVQAVNEYMASIASTGKSRNPLDPRPRNDSLDIPRGRNESSEFRRPSPPLRTNSEPADTHSISSGSESVNRPTLANTRQLSSTNILSSEDTSILSSILNASNSTMSLLDSSPESTPTAADIASSIKADAKASASNALLEIPPMNFSFFETESDELANLTKLLGTSIQLGGNEENANPDDENFNLNDKPPTPPPASSDRMSTDFINFPQPPLSIPRKSSNTSVSSAVGSEALPSDVQTLRAQLKASNAKLVETEANLNKIKVNIHLSGIGITLMKWY